MAAIYLKHPTHGTKVATMEMEAVFDESKGWKRYDPAKSIAQAEPSPEEPATPIINVMAPARRGRGRPPKGAS